MLLHTLGLTTDKTIQTALQKTVVTRFDDLSDQRGKYEPINKFDDDTVQGVVNHINKFNPSISHYRRMHAPNRLYISPEFTFTSMCKDFCESHGDTKFLMHIIIIIGEKLKHQLCKIRRGVQKM